MYYNLIHMIFLAIAHSRHTAHSLTALHFSSTSNGLSERLFLRAVRWMAATVVIVVDNIAKKTCAQTHRHANIDTCDKMRLIHSPYRFYDLCCKHGCCWQFNRAIVVSIESLSRTCPVPFVNMIIIDEIKEVARHGWKKKKHARANTQAFRPEQMNKVKDTKKKRIIHDKHTYTCAHAHTGTIQKMSITSRYCIWMRR